MKILLAHTYYRSSAPSGEDAVYENEKKLLLDSGQEVITYEKKNDYINDNSLFNKIRIAKNTTWSNDASNELSILLKKNKPDVVHVHNTFPQMSPSIYKACYDNKVPVIQTLHNFRFVCPGAMLQRNSVPCEKCLSERMIPYSALRYKCYRNSLLATSALVLMLTVNRMNGTYSNMVSKYIALTNFAAGKLIEGGLSSSRMVVKPNFIPDAGVYESNIVKQNYIVYVGRLSVEKGVSTLLKACALVNGLRVKILGNGPLLDELRDFSRVNSLDVEFMGFQNKATVLDVIKKSKFMVVPSEWYEGFPMTILEALSVGAPILASNIGSLKEIIEDGKEGVLFEPGNVYDLAQKITYLISNDYLLNEMSLNSRRLYLLKYSSEINIRKLLEIYESTLS